VIPVGSDGSVPATTEVSGKEYNGGTVAILTPKRITDDGTTTDGDNGNNMPVDDTNAPPASSPVPFPSPTTTTQKAKGTYRYGMLVFIVVLVMVLVAGYVMQSRRQAEQTTERALVFSYLQAFDVEDVDVRHSATGGWHGTYVGKLAQGEAELSHSSIVKDSLFVDYESKPTKVGMDDDDDGDGDDEEKNDKIWVDVDDVDLGTLSYTDRRENLSADGSDDDPDNPWGKEII
jgi:hypothetical protein